MAKKQYLIDKMAHAKYTIEHAIAHLEARGELEHTRAYAIMHLKSALEDLEEG